MTDLSKLIERLKAATGPDRELDRVIAVQFGGWTFERRKPNDNKEYWRQPGAEWFHRERSGPPKFTASVDASLALVERLLPGNKYHSFEKVPAGWWQACLDDTLLIRAPTAPLAILLALCTALQSKDETNVEGV